MIVRSQHAKLASSSSSSSSSHPHLFTFNKSSARNRVNPIYCNSSSSSKSGKTKHNPEIAATTTSPGRMHQLFAEVLSKKDLSRAGDLFSIDDKTIIHDLSSVIQQIQVISSASDFHTKHNDQSVVEICLTRITSAIRDSGTIEKHAAALVNLLESCLNKNLMPREKDEDPPHAKIAGDVVSCIFLNHSKKSVMKLAIPVAVKLLHRGNKELSRNLSSYLSLAAINNAEILAPHVQPIIDSIIGGNYCLARVLPKIYSVNQESIHDHIMALVCLLPQSETPEKISLLNLFSLISKQKPALLESNLPQLSECLLQSSTAYPTLQIFLDMVQSNAEPFMEYISKVIEAVEIQPGMLSIAAQFLGIIGKSNLTRASDCIEFFITQLSKCDLSTLITLLREIKSIIEIYPILLPSVLPDILAQTENSSSNTVQNYLGQLNTLNLQVTANSNNNNSSPGGQSATHLRVNCDTTSSFMSSNLRSNLLFDRESSSLATSSKNNSSSSKLGPTTNNIHVFHRSIPRLHVVNGGHIIGRHLSSSSNGVHMRSLTALQANSSSAHQNGTNYNSTSASRQQVNRMSIESMNISKNHAGGGSSGSQKSGSSSCGYLAALAEREAAHNINKSSKTVATSVDSQLQSVQTSNNPSASYYNIKTSSSSCGLKNGDSGHAHHNHLSNSISKLRSLEKNSSSSDYYGKCSSGARLPATTMTSNEGNAYSMRDAVQHFCEKHIDKIKSYMLKIHVKIPLPVKCTIEERKSKKIAKLHFLCGSSSSSNNPPCNCLYSKTFYVMKTRNAKIWIHLMFLALQSKASSALCTSEPSVQALKNCWDTLKADNKSFLALVTSSFPSIKDQDILMHELRSARYFDVFEFNALSEVWGCFLCNHPDRASNFTSSNEPVIEGQLKEKKGKWKLFRRWRTRYFTLSGLQLSYREAESGDQDGQPIGVGEIRSVKALGSSRGRTIPKAFEIFTNDDKTFVLKAKNSRNTEQWVQCLSIAMAHSQAKELSHHSTGPSSVC